MLNRTFRSAKIDAIPSWIGEEFHALHLITSTGFQPAIRKSIRQLNEEFQTLQEN